MQNHRLRFTMIGLALFGASFLLFFPIGSNDTPGAFKIVNAHEHLESLNTAEQYLEAMKEVAITQTVLLGTPKASFRRGEEGFRGAEEHSLEMIRLAKAHPGKFVVFPTLNVEDDGKLEQLKSYHQMGAVGLKLFSGHRAFYRLPLDHESMMPVYAYCEKEQIPILFHVNSGYYQEEFERVLKRFGKLKVVCPHFCLASIASDRFEQLMDTHPNLYTDISFGRLDYLKAGMLRISKDSEKFRKLFEKYQDRILFGTDIIVKDEPPYSAEQMTRVAKAYRSFLEEERYSIPEIIPMSLRGLHLEQKILKKIYETNWQRLMKKD